MRMTRAALRAQAQEGAGAGAGAGAGEELKEVLTSTASPMPMAVAIHVDEDAREEHEKKENDKVNGVVDIDSETEREELDRPVLKDITELNSSPISAGANLLHANNDSKNGKKEMMQQQQQQSHQHDGDASGETQAEAEAETEQPVVQPATQASSQDNTEPPQVATVTQTETETAAAAAETPRRTILSASKTPKFDPEIHLAQHSQATQELSNSSQDQEDSFVDSIKSRSPSKLRRESAQPDSFVQDITSRTPARPQPLIEDSVDAMDALEDAIEQVSVTLPKLDHLNLESPVKSARKSLSPYADKAARHSQSPLHTRSPAPSPTRSPIRSPTKNATPVVHKTVFGAKASSKTPVSADKGVPKPFAKQGLSATTPSTSKKVLPKTVAKPQPTPSKTLSARMSTARPTRPTNTTKRIQKPSNTKPSSKPATTMPQGSSKPAPARQSTTQLSFSNSPAKQPQQQQQQPKLGHSRKRTTSGSLSTSRPGFVPAKSTKAPTRPNFSLPGEAISAKMKAQREERARKEEEEKNRQNRLSFKARPAPPKTSRPSVAPRENRASQVRMSAIRTGSDKENVMPRQVPATANNPAKSVTVAKTRQDANHTKANSSVRRASVQPKPVAKSAAPVPPRVASLTAGEKLTASKEEAARQKVKGKEVFARAKMEKEAAEKEKREKEEAAKKARAEAAERGRQASREWAEKQKKKVAAGASAPVTLTV